MSFHRKKYLGFRRNFLSQKETSCHGKEFHAIVRSFLSQEAISCHRKKFLVRGRNVLSQKEISCHRKRLLVTGTNFMPQLKISCHREKYPNYRYFRRHLSRLTPAVPGEILAESIGSHEVKYFIPPCPSSIYTDLEKAASSAIGACGHFVGNHAILRTC